MHTKTQNGDQMQLVERTPQYSHAMAEGFISVIQDLHNNNLPRLHQVRQAAIHCGDREASAEAALSMLRLSFGLARLAVHAAQLQSAADNEVYARKFWTSLAMQN